MANQLFKLSLALAFVIAVQSYVRVCYYTNWSQYRNGIGKYSLSSHYEKGLCTHLIFSFAKVVNSNSGYTVDKYEWNDKSALYGQVKHFSFILKGFTFCYSANKKFFMNFTKIFCFLQMQALKKNNPNLKTLLAVGGWSHGSNGFKEMVATSTNRAQFVRNSMAFVQRYGRFYQSTSV